MDKSILYLAGMVIALYVLYRIALSIKTEIFRASVRSGQYCLFELNGCWTKGRITALVEDDVIITDDDEDIYSRKRKDIKPYLTFR